MIKNYREILKNEFEKRKQRNPLYSLRAFARLIDLSSPRLSDILNKKKGLSKEKALQIAKRLDLVGKESEYFVLLVESEHQRKKKLREEATKKLDTFFDQQFTLKFHLTIKNDQVDELKKDLTDFLETFNKKKSNKDNGKSYQLNLELLRLTRPL